MPQFSKDYIPKAMLLKGISTLLILSWIPLICPVDSFARHHGELCDWRSPTESCDQSRGLACSYKTQRCACWDIRTIYSLEKGRCVGKSGEECHYFGGERLCTEHAYCLEDESLSPIPICLCLKGFFKGSNGSCIRRAKYGEFCDRSTKYPASSSKPSSVGATTTAGIGHSTNSNCEPEAGLQCVNYKCQCEPNQIYDSKRELCISLAGMRCSRSLDNCVQNAECSEKIWAFDHVSGETKMIGHRCACKSGLKVTDDGFCAVEFGGNCTTSSECYFGEGLSCINAKCHCQPLSQVYDKRLRRCLNLVGSKCQVDAQQRKQDRQSQHSNKQQDSSERARQDLIIIKPQQTSSSFSQASKPVNSNTSPFTSAATSTTTVYTSTTTSTTSTPFLLLKSRNVTSRNFYFNNHNLKNNNRSVHFSTHRESAQRAFVHLISPRHNIVKRKAHQFEHLPVEHRGLPPSAQQCVTNAECMPSIKFSSSSESEADYYCKCRNGTSETILRTCLLDHGQPCGNQRSRMHGDIEPGQFSSSLECNVFEGLACMSDTGTCQCADPMLIYDTEARSCLSTVGNPCGKMKLNPMLLKEYEYSGGNKYQQDSLSLAPIPFYQSFSEQYMHINCVANASCVDKSVNGQFKQVCVPRSKYLPNSSNKFGFAS